MVSIFSFLLPRLLFSASGRRSERESEESGIKQRERGERERDTHIYSPAASQGAGEPEPSPPPPSL
eukprot:scaffold210046_cov22-Tisochrysis_lutea.AAC.1